MFIFFCFLSPPKIIKGSDLTWETMIPEKGKVFYFEGDLNFRIDSIRINKNGKVRTDLRLLKLKNLKQIEKSLNNESSSSEESSEEEQEISHDETSKKRTLKQCRHEPPAKRHKFYMDQEKKKVTTSLNNKRTLEKNLSAADYVQFFKRKNSNIIDKNLEIWKTAFVVFRKVSVQNLLQISKLEAIFAPEKNLVCTLQKMDLRSSQKKCFVCHRKSKQLSVVACSGQFYIFGTKCACITRGPFLTTETRQICRTPKCLGNIFNEISTLCIKCRLSKNQMVPLIQNCALCGKQMDFKREVPKSKIHEDCITKWKNSDFLKEIRRII